MPGKLTRHEALPLATLMQRQGGKDVFTDGNFKHHCADGAPYLGGVGDNIVNTAFISVLL